MSISDRLLMALAAARKRRLLDADPVARQDRLLGKLLRRGTRTVFGRRFDFGSIRSARDFLGCVPPQGPAELKESVDAILAEERDVLFPGRPVCFGATSGTEGEAKLVPLNRAQLRAMRASAIDAALLGGLARGSLAWHRGKTLYIGPRKGRPLGRWMVYREGTAFAYLQSRPCLARFVPQYESLPGPDEPQDWPFLARLAQEHAITAVAGNPLEIAEFLRATGIVLPGVQVVFNCGYWAIDHQDAFAVAMPNATLVDVYSSNEGTFGLPIEPGLFLLNYRRVFFSFLPMEGEGEAIGLADVTPRRKYRLCVTTPGGLWNYLTGDAVSLVSLRPPVLRLCGRADRALSLAGEQITEDEVVAAVRASGFRGLDYALAAAEDGYLLYTGRETADPGEVDRRLRQLNPDYDRLRAGGRLGPLRVCPRSLGTGEGMSVRPCVGRTSK